MSYDEGADTYAVEVEGGAEEGAASYSGQEAEEATGSAAEVYPEEPTVSRGSRVNFGPTLSAQVSQNSQILLSEAPVDVGLTSGLLYLWLRRCQRKFTAGLTVIKVLSNGKIVRRQLFIGAKAEYLELTSSKLFDIAYHLGDIVEVNHGIQSPEFGALLIADENRRPKPNKCLVIKLSEASISLIFKTEADRRDAQFLLRVQKKAILQRYATIKELFESRQKESGIGLPNQ
eukprot:Blabericola_migrator_1__3254@NODE_195_length_11539_cov_221_635547_g168_i0_p6_GENE_NODE_195_length_11539_cov_221_635547_g168_i0NODE_195_length_11539_cov_221_635547_g168_i0_p6_ORF_typecomplete_len231_score55_01Mucin_bdg/PF03272_13/1_9e02Mucin_bdg/PF03272_13/4_7_NODE_195_length_11539_cov_221_635547_g168_i022012893